MRRRVIATVLLTLAAAVVLLTPGLDTIHGPFLRSSDGDRVTSENLAMERLGEPFVTRSLGVPGSGTFEASDDEVFLVIPVRLSTISDEVALTGVSLDAGGYSYASEPAFRPQNAGILTAMPRMWTELEVAVRVSTRAVRGVEDIRVIWQDGISTHSQFVERVALDIPWTDVGERESHELADARVAGAWN